MGQKIKHRQQKLPKRFGTRDMLPKDSFRDRKRNEKKQKFQEEFQEEFWSDPCWLEPEE
jgi:hypothetical protein